VKILFFDTETTGIIPSKTNYAEDYDRFPYIVQLAWIFDNKEYDYVIKPNGYVISEESIQIHGITQQKALTTGGKFTDVVEFFLYCADNAQRIVAHNIYFDTSVIKANIIRETGTGMLLQWANSALHKTKRVDTMKSTVKFCGLGKYPTLQELHTTLFGESFDAHNAMNDVEALKKCYEQLIELEII